MVPPPRAGWRWRAQACRRPLMMLQHGTRSSSQSVSPDVSSHLTQPFGPCASMPPCRWPTRPGGHAISSRILRRVAPDLMFPFSSFHVRDPPARLGNAIPRSQSAVFFFFCQRFGRRHGTLLAWPGPVWNTAILFSHAVPLTYTFVVLCSLAGRDPARLSIVAVSTTCIRYSHKAT